MTSLRRIMIIGPSGSGKSTLARAIAARLDIPAIHLDVLFWQPGWVETPQEVFRAKIIAAASGDAWVMDGNYSRHFDVRLARADTVIWLDLPRHVYFPRAFWRMVKNYGRERGDIGPGCRERFDLAFYRDWVWPYPTKTRPKHAALIQSLPQGLTGVRLATRGDIRRFVAGLVRDPAR